MNNPKHTPGPWQIKETRSQSGNAMKCIERAIPAKGGINGLIAVLPDRVPSPAQWEPNARLIAAAPELLEALELSVKTLKRCDQTPAVVKTIDYLEAAIAKATGGSNE